MSSGADPRRGHHRESAAGGISDQSRGCVSSSAGPVRPTRRVRRVRRWLQLLLQRRRPRWRGRRWRPEPHDGDPLRTRGRTLAHCAGTCTTTGRTGCLRVRRRGSRWGGGSDGSEHRQQLDGPRMTLGAGGVLIGFRHGSAHVEHGVTGSASVFVQRHATKCRSLRCCLTGDP